MKSTIFKAGDRGQADFGWLKPNYYFSFSRYYNPERERFGLLRVLNDDMVAGGGAFATHPHDNMEIVTIPLSGAIVHKDSTGANGVIKAGDVQIMSAGSGVQHSEANASKTEALNLFQVWIFPKEIDIKPRYEQKTFDAANRQNEWQIVVSPREQDGGLWINQDARFALANLEAGKKLTYTPAFPGNGVFLLVVNGSVKVGDVELAKRDAIGIEDSEAIEIEADGYAELLAIEVPMN